jgi:hypothetical protein
LYAIVEIVQHVFGKNFLLRKKNFRAARFSARVTTQLRAAKSKTRARAVDQ